jgi:hypothetical protein
LKISAPLDREWTYWYNLTVMVSDGISDSDVEALNDTAMVFVSVIASNDFTTSYHVSESLTTAYSAIAVSVVLHAF